MALSTPNQSFNKLLPNQGDTRTKYNLLIMMLDAASFGLTVINQTTTAPPGSPSDGDVYIPAATATGVWATHENDITIYDEDSKSWLFIIPSGGMRLEDAGDSGSKWRFQDSSGLWVSDTGSGVLLGDLPFGNAGEQFTTNEAETAMELVLASKYISVRKGSAGTINSGQPVYISGWNTGAGVIEVELADADAVGENPAVGLAFDSLTSGANGRVLGFGNFENIDTSSWSVGDRIYVSATPGTLTAIPPTGDSEIQSIGTVARSHASFGQLVISGAGRSNATPNLSEFEIFHGQSDDSTTTVLTMYQNAANPTVDDDIDLGFIVGSTWINTSTGLVFTATNVADGAAVWKCMGCMASGYFTLNGASAPTADKMFNMTSLTRNSMGVYTALVPASLPNSQANGRDYVFSLTVLESVTAAGGVRLDNSLVKTATTVQFILRDGTGAVTDDADAVEMSFEYIGD